MGKPYDRASGRSGRDVALRKERRRREGKPLMDTDEH
jgi:hypothetical protein